MIINIIYSVYSLGNLNALAKLIEEYLAQKFPDTPLIAATLNPLRISMAVATKAIGSSIKSPLTVEIEKADRERDNIYASLRDLVVRGVQRQKTDYRAACMALSLIFEKNNLQLYALPYQDETSAIESLLADLDNDEAKANLETIKATEWVAELDAANKYFVEIYTQRAGERAADDTLPDKTAILRLYNSLDLVCNALVALYAMEEPGANEAIAQVNQFIKEANRAAHRAAR